jgi:TonB-dependent receptor
VDTRLGRFPALLKFGAKMQLREKDIDESSERFTNPALTLAGWSLPAIGGLQGDATPFVHGDVARFNAFVRRNRTASDSLKLDQPNTSVQAIDNDAYVQERITAGYLMSTTEVGRLTALAGVRFERTDSDAEFFKLLENSRLPAATRYDFPESRTTAHHNYTHWLPSAIVKYDATDALVLRGAFTSTIGRPQYTQLAGYTRANYLPDLTNPNIFEGTVSASNPDLMPYAASNFDLSAEYYLETGGQLSVGGFYKRVDNPIYSFSSTQRNITYDDRFFTQLKYSQLRNGDAGTFRGVELAYSQPLYFLPRPLNGLGITTNVAFIHSELSIVGRNDKLPFLGQPDRVVNLIPYYQRGPFEVRFALAHRSHYLTAVETPGLDRFVDSRHTMDMNVRYQVRGQGLELIATARNLANAPEVRYQGDRSQYDLHVLTGRTFSVGVRTTR